jgi:hypothetical protein
VPEIEGFWKKKLAGILLVLGLLRPKHQACTIFRKVENHLPNDTVAGDINSQHKSQ